MRAFGLIVLFSLLSQAAWGEALTASVIERWLASQQDIKEWGDKHEAAFDEQDDARGLEVSDFIEPLKRAGLYNDMKGLLSGHGFTSPEQWAQATIQIVSAYAKTQMNSTAMAVKPEDLRAQFQQIEDSPHLNAEQKQQMQAMLQSSIDMMERVKQVPDEDVSAIKPYLSQLNEAMRDNEDESIN